MMHFLETAAPYIKILGTAVTAALAVAALFGETYDRERHKLTPLGRRLIVGMVTSGFLALASAVAENQLDRNREREQRTQYAHNLARQDSALFRLQIISDSLTRLRVISDSLSTLRLLSETTLARQDSQLQRTAGVADAIAANSATQASLLSDQQLLARDAARLLYPFSNPAVQGRWVYQFSDTVIRAYAETVRIRAHMLLNEWRQAILDSMKARPSGGFRLSHRVAYVPSLQMLSDAEKDIQIFSQLPRSSGEGKSSVDSVMLDFRSTWLPASVPIVEDLAEIDFELRFNREERHSEPGDLSLWVSVPSRRDIMVQGEERTGQERPPGFSSGYIVVNFVDGTVVQDFISTRVWRERSSGAISSILDLPGTTMTVRTEGVGYAGGTAYPVRSERFYLVLEGGRGRPIRVRDREFTHVPARFDTTLMWWERLGASFTHTFSVSDVESQPGEFARFFRSTRQER